MKHACVFSVGVFLLLSLAGGPVVAQKGAPPRMAVPEYSVAHEEIRNRLTRYVPADIGLPAWDLNARTRELLGKLVDAAQAIDLAFWDQVSEGGCDLLAAVSARPDAPSQDYAAFLRQNYGPWDRIADHEPFIGHDARPAGANLYPADLSRRELEKWLADHPGDRGTFESPWTVIRRLGAGLTAVPYSRQYPDHLAAAAKALREAAELSDCPALTRFLKARADAFGSNEYGPSDLLWLQTSSCPVDVAIGPYEVYEDQLMGWKTAFEAFVMVRDDLETTKAGILMRYGEELLANLPLESPGVKGRFDVIKGEPILVANEVFAAGDARAGFQVRAFVLPNDEALRREKGTRHVILENVVRARFVHLLQPLAQVVLAPDQAAYVDYDAYFKLMLTWELAHGLAPKAVPLADGDAVAPRVLLRQRYGLVEAARAEAVGLLNALLLVDKGVFPSAGARTLPATWLASLFESMRFGTTDALGQAKLVVLNRLLEADAVRYDPATKRFGVNYEKLHEGLRALVADLLSIELNGDYVRAGRLIVDHGVVSGEVRAKLTALARMPVDIRPNYTILAGPH